jgi:hypothetical protein
MPGGFRNISTFLHGPGASVPAAPPPILWYPCCCGCACANCLDGAGPRRFQIDVTGLGPSDPEDCTHCDDLNATYVVTCQGTDQWGTCTWSYELESTICGVARIELRIEVQQINSPYKWPVDVYLLSSAGDTIFWRQKLYDDRFDCLHADGESLGDLWQPPGWHTCDKSASEVKITAL